MPANTLFQLEEQGRRPLAKASVTLLIALQIVLVMWVLGGVYAATQQLRQVTLDNLQSHASLQSQNLSEQLTQSMNLLHLHFDALLSDHPDAAIDPDVLRGVLQQLQSKLHFIRSISVVDVSSHIFVSTRATNEHTKVDLGTLLPESSLHSTGLLRFAAPWHGRDFAGGQRFTADTQLPRPDAGFFPVTLVLPDVPHWTFLVAVNSDFFINAAPPYKAAGDLAYRVLLDNGTLLFSSADNEQPGTQPLSPEHLQQVLQHHSGTQHWLDEHNQQQLGAYHASYSYPWFVHAQASADYALQQWRTDSRRLWLGACSLLAVMLLVGGLFTRRAYRTLQQEQHMLEKNRLAAMVFMHSNDLIGITDSNRALIAVNPAYETITGYTAAEALGRIPGTFRTDPDSEATYASLWHTLESGNQWQGEISEYHKDGHLITGQLQVNTIRDEQGKILNYVGVFKDLSQLHASEATLLKLSQAVEQSPSSIVITTSAANIEYANPQFLALTGYSRDEVMGVNPRILQSGKTLRPTYIDLWRRISSGQVWHGEFINRRKDGSLYYERCSISPVLDNKGQLTGYLGIKHDVTAEKEAEQAMRLAASVTANTAESIMVCDANERIIEVNPAFTRLTGYSSDEVLGQHPSMLCDGQRNSEVYTELRATLAVQDQWQGEFWNRSKNGTLYAIAGTISVIRDEAGNLTHYVSIFSDATENKRQQESLQQQAHFDPLTGLPNRSLLNERLAQAMARSIKHQHQLAVCFMDLDGFKQVNDSLGHQAGDELLICVAKRLKDCLRGDDTVARLGGDEFVLLLNPVRSLEECEQIIGRILTSVAQPIALGSGQQASVTASIGITLFPCDSGSAEQLMRHADHAMYQAKQNGRNGYVISPKALQP
ncbi:MAG: PAS domain S-box protein [Thiopseudomonas sp.]|nr:PAS domain S-box protein [Thiopseudomonas sp.]